MFYRIAGIDELSGDSAKRIAMDAKFSRCAGHQLHEVEGHLA
jgi:hypothetical protein